MKIVPLLMAILLCVPFGCGERTSTVDEAAEIMVEGGAEYLRDSVRPATGPPRVLIFALDGVGHSALHGALERGALPTLAAFLGSSGDSVTFDHGVSAGPVLSVLPSITLAAWTTLFTGATPGATGVPGNEWFDRDTGEFHAPAPISVKGQADALATLSDQLLDSLVLVPTLFEQAGVRSYVSLLPVHRGADILALPGGGELAELLAAFPAGAVGDEPVDRELYESVDHASSGRMVDLIQEEGPPDLAVVYFPGIDLYTHAAEGPLAEQQRYLAEVTDSAVAAVLAAYREAGALEGTYVLVVSDHGHTPVLNDAVHALGGDSAFSVRNTLEDAGFRVRPDELDTDADDYQAVMAWQGAFAYVSLADRATCMVEGDVCVWPRSPRWDDDVLPAARALERAATSHHSRPLDMVILRMDAQQGDGSELSVLRDGRPVPLAAYLEASPRPELLAFAERLGWLTTGAQADQAGDIILMTRLGASSPSEERYYFSKPYYSWHASAEARDSHAPLILARSDLSGAELRRLLDVDWGAEPTQLDFTSLVLRLLEIPDDAADRR